MPGKYVAPTRPANVSLRDCPGPGVSARARPVLLAAAALALAGCSESAGPSSPGVDAATAAPITVAALNAEMAGAFCQQMQRCCNAEDLGALAPALRTAIEGGAACATAARVTGFLDNEFSLAQLRQSVEAGRARFDPQQAGACVAHLRGLGCPAWSAALKGQGAALGLACQRMVRGNAADGTACTLNFEHECASGTCAGAAGATTCGPAPGAGQACSARCQGVFDCADRCADPLLCSPDGTCAANPAPRPVPPQCDGP
jgi:hypothetical protein